VYNWHCILKGTYCTRTKGKNQKGCEDKQIQPTLRYYPVTLPDGKTVMTEGLKEKSAQHSTKEIM
jgi:hypothetical protein